MTDNQNEDQQQEERGAVPYQRFKAVNDKYRAALAELETARQTKDTEGNDGDGEDWKAKHDAAQAELSALKRARLQDRAALEHGIPLDIAQKIEGDDEASIMADAKRLAQYMGDMQRRPLAPKIDGDTPSDAPRHPGRIDLESIRDPAFYNANREAIWQAVKQGRLGNGLGAVRGGIAAINKVING